MKPVLVTKGCTNGIKDNIALVKSVLFSSQNLLLINIPTLEKTDIIRFLLRDRE